MPNTGNGGLHFTSRGTAPLSRIHRESAVRDVRIVGDELPPVFYERKRRGSWRRSKVPFPIFRYLGYVRSGGVSFKRGDRKRTGMAMTISIAITSAGIVIGLIGAGSYYGITTGASIMERRIYMADREIAHQILRARSDLTDFLATGRTELLQGHQASMKKLDESLAAMRDASREGGVPTTATRAAVESLNAAIQDWDISYARVAIKLRLANSDRPTNILRGMQQKGISATHSRTIERRLDALQRSSDSWLADLRGRASARRRTALWILLAGILVLLGGAAYFVSWHVIQRRIQLLLRARLEDLGDYADRMHHLANADEAATALTASIGGKSNRSTVLLRIPGEPGMRIAAFTGQLPPDAGTSPVLGDRGACPVMRTGERFLLRDPRIGPPCECPACASRDDGYACVPLLAQGKTAGLINWQAGKGLSLTTAEINRIEEFARVTSLALTNLFSLEGAKHDAVTDQLTGVANRRFLDGYLAKQLQISLRQKRPLGVLMLDLDLFKAFNDRNGHQAGDSLLRAAARTTETAVRDEDLVARYGGEEFAVVLPDADMKTTLEVAERIRSGISQMNMDEYPSLHPPLITVSIGAVVAPANGRTSHEVLRVADLALYEAKEKGRNRVVAVPEHPSASSSGGA